MKSSRDGGERTQLMNRIRRAVCPEDSSRAGYTRLPIDRLPGRGTWGAFKSLHIQSKVLEEKLPGRAVRRFCTRMHMAASPPILLGNVLCSKHGRGLLEAFLRPIPGLFCRDKPGGPADG